MTDVLVRDLPDEVIAAVDSLAASMGLSRSEFLRRRLTQEATGSTQPVTQAHLAAFAVTFADLVDPQVMSGTWE